MIHIEKNQEIPENEGMRVFSETGDYADFDQIEYYNIDNPEIAIGALQAQFIRYGGLVYRFNEPKDLGVAILEIDPESTHSAASFVRMNNELLKQMTEGSLEANSLDQVMSEEQTKMEEAVDQTNNTNDTNVPKENTETLDTPVVEENTEISSPVVDSPTEVSTTTPAISSETSTSTEPVIISPVTSVEATSTVEVAPTVLTETASSTPEIISEPPITQ